MKAYSPERAMAEILGDLRKKVLYYQEVEEILPIGSVPLGTYVGEPDLDIAILVPRTTVGVMRALSGYYPRGHQKEGELDIWYVPNLYGYDTDFVVMQKDDVKVPTMNHVRYYMEVLTPEMRGKIQFLKNFFKDINCYGAEVGGITGICITRMAELYDVRKGLDDLLQNLVHWGRHHVEDPTIRGRNLFASVTELKKQRMIPHILFYLWEERRTLVDMEYFMDNYSKLYEIKRKRSMGTDKEFQFVYSTVRKSWKSFYQRIRWWDIRFDYDILMTPYYIYVGFNMEPRELTVPAVEYICKDNLSQVAYDKLIKLGAEENEVGSGLMYTRKPPFKNLVKEFEKVFIPKLQDKYIEVNLF